MRDTTAMPATRDPASVLLDNAARKLLTRAYASPGKWQGTRLADPSVKIRRYLQAIGIDPSGPDNPSAAGGRRGGLNARDRWSRAFCRALYWQHRWYSPDRSGGHWRAEQRAEPRHAGALRVEFGRRMVPAGVIPAGRAVRIMYAPGGDRALRAVRRLSDRDRIYDDTGVTAQRWSDPSRRDW